MINKVMVDLRREYYYNEDVLQKLCFFSNNKELVFMDKDMPMYCIRMLFAKNPEGFKWLFRFYNFNQEKQFYKVCNYNMYVSTADYSYIPRFDFNLRNRSRETRTYFRESITDFMSNYEILFDFDFNPDTMKWEIFRGFVLTVANKLLSDGIVFMLFPSGSGFQLVIPSWQFKGIKKEFFINKNGFNTYARRFIYGMIDYFKFPYKKMFCVSGIGTLSKIRKLPFSLVNNTALIPFWNLTDLFNFDYYNVMFSKGKSKFPQLTMENNNFYFNYIKKDEDKTEYLKAFSYKEREINKVKEWMMEE